MHTQKQTREPVKEVPISCSLGKEPGLNISPSQWDLNRPHSDGRCVLCRTTRPSLDVYTKLAIHFFRRKTKMNRANKRLTC